MLVEILAEASPYLDGMIVAMLFVAWIGSCAALQVLRSSATTAGHLLEALHLAGLAIRDVARRRSRAGRPR